MGSIPLGQNAALLAKSVAMSKMSIDKIINAGSMYVYFK